MHRSNGSGVGVGSCGMLFRAVSRERLTEVRVRGVDVARERAVVGIVVIRAVIGVIAAIAVVGLVRVIGRVVAVIAPVGGVVGVVGRSVGVIPRITCAQINR